jgi:hypothetical protein
MDICAAWNRKSAGKRDYVARTLDDPTISAPLNARLVEADDSTLSSTGRVAASSKRIASAVLRRWTTFLHLSGLVARFAAGAHQRTTPVIARSRGRCYCTRTR